MGLTEMLFFAAVGLQKFSGEPRYLIVQYFENWFLSVIGASIEKMCNMKYASFFLNLRKRKLHVEISPDLYEFCGYLKQSCLGNTPRKGRYKFKTCSNTFDQFLMFDVRKKRRKKQWIDKCYFYAAVGLQKFSGEPRYW